MMVTRLYKYSLNCPTRFFTLFIISWIIGSIFHVSTITTDNAQASSQVSNGKIVK